jgi:cobalt-zinc-cadmium efflux system membrane fusion protein
VPGEGLATAEVRVSRAAALAVPVEAVCRRQGRDLVYRREGAGFRPVEVRTGFWGERFVEVTSGLKPGDEVAGSGLFWLEAQASLQPPL